MGGIVPEDDSTMSLTPGQWYPGVVAEENGYRPVVALNDGQRLLVSARVTRVPPVVGQPVDVYVVPTGTTRATPVLVIDDPTESGWAAVPSFKPGASRAAEIVALHSDGVVVDVDGILGFVGYDGVEDHVRRDLREGETVRVTHIRLELSRRLLSAAFAGIARFDALAPVRQSESSDIAAANRRVEGVQAVQYGWVLHSGQGQVTVRATNGDVLRVELSGFQVLPVAGQVIGYLVTISESDGRRRAHRILQNPRVWTASRALLNRGTSPVQGRIVALFLEGAAVAVGGQGGAVAAMWFDRGDHGLGVGSPVSVVVTDFNATSQRMLVREANGTELATHAVKVLSGNQEVDDRLLQSLEDLAGGASRSRPQFTVGGYIKELLDTELADLEGLDEAALDEAAEAVNWSIAEALIRLGPPPTATGRGGEGPGGSDEGSPVGSGGQGGGRKRG